MATKTAIGVSGEVKAGKNQISFIFVTSHVGVRGKEHANRLAGKATVESGRSMELSDILQAIKEASRENYSLNDIVCEFDQIA
jgi:hypothetical protein